MKRFYKIVSINEDNGKYAVMLDGKVIKTPFMNILTLPNLKLAEEIKSEWEAQKDELDIKSMPITNIAYTWQDKILPKKSEIIKAISEYLKTELICYVSPDGELYKQQIAKWQPIADIFEKDTSIKLNFTKTISSAVQTCEDLEKFTQLLENLPAPHLTAMQITISLLGSAVVSYEFAKGNITIEQAFDAAMLEEIFQSKKWGLDPAIENKHKSIKNELANIDKFLKLVK